MTNKIEVIGLGAGDIEQLPLGIYRKLQDAKGVVYTRTLDHPVIDILQKEGVHFHSFDDIYKKHDDFEAVYKEIVELLVRQAKENPTLYAVPGHPLLAEKTVQLLFERTDVKVEILGGHSYLDAIFTSLKIDPIEGFQFIDATSFTREDLNFTNHIIFCQVYDQFIASEVKLTLLEDLPPDFQIKIVEAAGTKMEKIHSVKLEDLDRVVTTSNLLSVYVPPVPETLRYHQFSTLRSIIKILRGPNGCPWDRKQTHESLREYAIEEVYELIDAINRKNDEDIIEELGDVLLQVMLHSQIGEDEGYFTIDDVIQRISEKMIHRHPHVFEPEKEWKSWDDLKREEKKEAKESSILDSIVTHAPALQVAYKLQKKAAKVGFDWPDVSHVWEKLEEELQEFREASAANDKEEMEKEFGDILFVLANIAKFYQINPEIALGRTNEKFIQRFKQIEESVRQEGKELSEMSLKQLDKYWEEAKRKE